MSSNEMTKDFNIIQSCDDCDVAFDQPCWECYSFSKWFNINKEVVKKRWKDPGRLDYYSPCTMMEMAERMYMKAINKAICCICNKELDYGPEAVQNPIWERGELQSIELAHRTCKPEWAIHDNHFVDVKVISVSSAD